MRQPWDVTRDMFLSESETRQLLAHVRRPVRSSGRKGAANLDRLIVEALVFSGLRNSEFCRLRLRDTIISTGESVFLVHGTPRQDRTVYVPAAVSDLVSRYVAEIRPRYLPDDLDPTDRRQPLVFNERRRPYERTGLYRRMVRILSDAGFESRASVQLLRHTYGYLAYKGSGGNLLFIQRQMGHAHPMVSSVYAQFVDECYADLANRTGELAEVPAPVRRRSRTVRRRIGANQ